VTEPAGAQTQNVSPAELNRQAGQALSSGDYAGARALLVKALQIGGDNPVLWLNLAGACRAMGDVPNAMAAVERVLRIDPRSFMGLLLKASLLERLNRRKPAADLYAAASGLAPPREAMDVSTQRALDHGREFHAQYIRELAEFVHAEMGSLRERGSSAEAQRAAEFIDLAVGRRRAYRQQPTEFFYPGLPAREFYDRDEFAWIRDFEAATPQIRDELLQILQSEFRDFVPYVNYRDSLPLDQWRELNRSAKWGALHLYEYGERVEKNASRCPQTMAAIDRLPQPRVPRRSPAAMFSALQPKTRIPPHTGVANTRLVVHLPLVVPPGCGFRVGNETREWREGEAWVFDDTMEHEAWNDSDAPRVILICDIWHPQLSATERDLITGVMAAMDKFNGTVPRDGL